VNFQFYGYTVRETTTEDTLRAYAWTRSSDWGFWLQQGHGRESFIVFEGERGLAFFQIEHVGEGGVPPMTDQVRLHFQAAPAASPKKLLLAITRLVPLIEKALALRGVRAIFFTSHSPAMAHFMAEHHGYERAGDGGVDGVVMAKRIGRGEDRGALEVMSGFKTPTYTKIP
jgi:hypothetical protein